MGNIFLLGRVIFGAYFIYSGIMHFKNEKEMTLYAKSKGVPQAKNAVILTGIMLIVGGAGVFINYPVSLSGILLLVFLIPTTFVMHNFWNEKSEEQKRSDLNNFLKNIALIGALLMIIAKFK